MLDKRNIAVRAGLHCAPLAHKYFGTEEMGTVRAVVSYFTDLKQIDYFTKCILEINKYKK
jgi:selenocysteine lyase/cysteine desulfurase